MGKKTLKKTPKEKKDKNFLEICLGEAYVKIPKDVETINTIRMMLAVYEGDLLRNEPKVPQEIKELEKPEDEGTTEIDIPEVPEVPEERPDVVPIICPLCSSKIKKGKSKRVGDKIMQVFKCKKNKFRIGKRCNFIKECIFQI